MPLLILLAPPRPRPASAEEAVATELPASHEWPWVLTRDELSVERTGHAPMSLLPATSRVVLVLPAADVGWQRVVLPRGAAGRQRAALAGLLEDRLLADTERCHFALAPEPSAGAGDGTWVAVVDRAWLQGLLQSLEAAGLAVERVVPAFAPTLGPQEATGGGAAGPWRVHVHGSPEGGEAAWTTLAGPSGTCQLPLATLATPGATPWPDGAELRCTAEPAHAAAAERWRGQPVALQNLEERLVEAAASPWNLRQFDLAPSRRGWRALRGALQGLSAPAWRPARWGLAALVAVQLVGLNAWAWQQERALRDRRVAMTALLQQTHPQVRLVVDAPLQMQRETERLRASAGQAGPGDLEPLLAAVSAAWPADLPPVQALRYEPGRLSLLVPGVDEGRLAPVRERLQAVGLQAEWRDGRLILAAQGGR